jgi:ribonuclease HI
MIIENAINVYADGSSSPGPRVGGIGIRLVIVNSLGQQQIEDVSLPGYAGATNNQMELRACIEGIKRAMRHPAFDNISRIAVHSDSQYVVDNYKRAFFSWYKNKWRNREGRPVDNALLWKELLKTVRTRRKWVEFYWVKGHAKDEHNKAADKLARQSSRNAINPPLNIVKVRRKLSAKSVDPGCVPMRNQRISIRIITDEYLIPNKCSKFKYEVISKHSPYYGNIDFAFSENILDAGHCYSVRFNDNPKYPMIRKIFKELPKLKKSPPTS